MPLEPAPVWKQTFAQLPTTDKKDWATKMAQWLGERTTNKLQLMPIVGPVMFSFQVGVFESKLKAITETDKAQTGGMNFSDALQSALMASTMTVTPGCCLGAPTPATTWSAVATLIDGSSVQMAKASLLQALGGAKEVDDPNNSSVPEAFRTAILLLTCSVNGMNCAPPAPTPLMSPFTPVS